MRRFPVYLTPPEVEVLRLGISLVADDTARLQMVKAPATIFDPATDIPSTRGTLAETRLATEYIKEQRRALASLDHKLRMKPLGARIPIATRRKQS
jgi:hypothetical protein